MTTETTTACPVCGLTCALFEGKLTSHTVKGDFCPGGRLSVEAAAELYGRDVQETVTIAGGPGTSVSATTPGHAETWMEPPAPVAPVDTKLDKKRKPRSDAGHKRPPKATAPETPPLPKRKHRPQSFIVVDISGVEIFTTLAAAEVAMGKAMAAGDGLPEGSKGARPLLFVGHRLQGEYEPAKNIPARWRAKLRERRA